jgi:predicted lipoprotein
MRLLLAAVFAFIAAPAVADPTIPTNEIISGAIDTYIRPNFRQFASDTAALKSGVGALCATPSTSALSAAQGQFKTVATSFSRAEFLHFGPLTIGDRAERLLFWPDSKGIALKQVQQALAQKDPTAADPETLKKKSVAMQGLGALEFVLFGTGNEEVATPDGAYRCGYGSAIATLVAGIAATLDTEWQDKSPDGPEAHMLSPKPDADDYRTQKEVLEKLAGSLIVGTETIRDQRISPVIGAAANAPKPKSALFWRSGMTIPSLTANVQGLKDFFLAARFPEAVKGNLWISNGAIFEFDNALTALGKITDPIDKAVTDPRQMQQLNYVSNITRSMDTLLGDNLSGALGLTLGFSRLDGD